MAVVKKGRRPEGFIDGHSTTRYTDVASLDWEVRVQDGTAHREAPAHLPIRAKCRIKDSNRAVKETRPEPVISPGRAPVEPQMDTATFVNQIREIGLLFDRRLTKAV